MSQSKVAVTIFDVAAASPVNAMLHEGLDDVEVINVEISWGPKRLRAMRDMLKNGVDPADMPQHVHWNWALKTLRNSGMLNFKAFGIRAARKMQGLMLVDLSSEFARLNPDQGKPLVYVDYLETAPWNAREFTNSPLYKGVGLVLMQAAAKCSIAEGFSGRVGLHSLRQSRPFYTGPCEMTALGPDANYDNLEYFELPAAKAAGLIQK